MPALRWLSVHLALLVSALLGAALVVAPALLVLPAAPVIHRWIDDPRPAGSFRRGPALLHSGYPTGHGLLTLRLYCP